MAKRATGEPSGQKSIAFPDRPPPPPPKVGQFTTPSLVDRILRRN